MKQDRASGVERHPIHTANRSLAVRNAMDFSGPPQSGAAT